MIALQLNPLAQSLTIMSLFSSAMCQVLYLILLFSVVFYGTRVSHHFVSSHISNHISHISYLVKLCHNLAFYVTF